MSNYENINTTRKSKSSFDSFEEKNKIRNTLKNLKKENERRNREPSIRLGKNLKKQFGRSKFVTDEKNDYEQELESVLIISSVHRIPLKRIRRKVGHRERRPDTINFDEYFGDGYTELD